MAKTGVEVDKADLVPFGSLSEAGQHMIHYPNGDLTHCSSSASSPVAGAAIPGRMERRRWS